MNKTDTRELQLRLWLAALAPLAEQVLLVETLTPAQPIHPKTTKP